VNASVGVGVFTPDTSGQGARGFAEIEYNRATP